MSDSWPGSRKKRDTLLRLPIGDLAAWHLMVSCAACRAERIVPVGKLIDVGGPDTTLLKLVPRLRCSAPACRRPPSRIRLRSKFPPQPGPDVIEVVLLEATTQAGRSS